MCLGEYNRGNLGGRARVFIPSPSELKVIMKSKSEKK